MAGNAVDQHAVKIYLDKAKMKQVNPKYVTRNKGQHATTTDNK